MKYSPRTIPTTKRDWLDAAVFVRAHAPDGVFPAWSGLDFDGAFQRLILGLDNLRRGLGEELYAQLQDMLQQSIAHFDEGFARGGIKTEAGLDALKLGSWLMQDIDEVLSGDEPFAYPKALYRWPHPTIN
jgi:hypothetical protein